jgi:methyl-accepting chemotaxis protein
MKKALEIRWLLPALILAIAALTLVAAGIRTYDAWIRREDAARFIEVDRAEERLLTAIGSFARERGQTSANVQTVAAATEEMSISIREIAAQVTQSFHVAERAVADARRTNGAVQSLADSAEISRNVQEAARGTDAVTGTIGEVSGFLAGVKAA